MIDALAEALDTKPYSLKQTNRESLMLRGLNELTKHHHTACLEYRRILAGAWPEGRAANSLANVPYLPVSLFKEKKLQSIPDDKIRLTLTSSGTSGQAVSRIALDAEASAIQQKALANSLMHVVGTKRLPMLVLDTDAVFKDPSLMSARGAGVLGLMRYGRNHAFSVDRDLNPDLESTRRFLDTYSGQPFLMFGFTFMVWTQFYAQFKDLGFDLSMGILIHSGGWKKMVEQSVDNAVFRKAMGQAFGLNQIYNFYGMVEQIGSIFLEGPNGLLYPPNFSDVIIRDPITWEPAENGSPGVIQVLSLLPHSYPGHSLLTEDLGVIESIDPGTNGWMGKGIRILGRVSRSELRGCSDVIGAAA